MASLKSIDPVSLVAEESPPPPPPEQLLSVLRLAAMISPMT